MNKLVISDDEGKTTVVPLVRDEITIGRKEGNTIRLTERNVSRRHAKLVKRDGAFVIEDLGSYNGVKLNGRRIEGAETLESGDQIAIGDYVIALQGDAIEASPTVTDVAIPGAMAGSRPPARLVMLTPPTPGAEFSLRDGMRLGRAEDLEIWVNHRSISREHATIHSAGDGFTVRDLDSANGMRLNGEELREARLTPGDVLELGQVRFRFVGEGEAYVFDSDRTMQMDALPILEEPQSKVPLFAAAAIVLVALIAGAAIALGGDPEQPEGVEASPITQPGTDAPSEGGQALDLPQQYAQRCRTSLGNGDFSEALRHAEAGLAIAPGHGECSACKEEVEVEQRYFQYFSEAQELLAAGDFDNAFFNVFDPTAIPEDHPLRNRDEALQICRRYVAHHLTLARGASGDGVIEHVAHVEGAPCVTDSQRREARQLRPASAPAPTTPPSPMGVRRPRMRPVVTQMTTMEAPMSAAPLSARDVLRECNFDNRCLVSRLRGRANNPSLAQALINAYGELGNGPAKRQEMQRFVSRWPNHSRANRYRQMLSQ